VANGLRDDFIKPIMVADLLLVFVTMSHVNGLLLPVVNVDRKPFPFPVSETAAAVYGGPSSSAGAGVDIGSTSNHSPFAAASPPPWHRLPQPSRSGYLDQPDYVRTSLGHSFPGSISPRVAAPSYGCRTRPDDGGITGGLFLPHSLNGLQQPARNEPSLPASCYLSNAGNSHQPCIDIFIHHRGGRNKQKKTVITITTIWKKEVT